jgi:hypothetical protein
LNSKVATAFVSLLMTAVLGNVILSLMQQRNKERGRQGRSGEYDHYHGARISLETIRG